MTPAVPMGAYVPGSSVFHRLPPLTKLLGLVVLIVLILVTARTLPVALGWCVMVLAAYVVAHVPWALALRQIGTAVPVVALLCAYQWYARSAVDGAILGLGLIATIAAANLLTLTTTVADLFDAVADGLAPLERVGVDPEPIALAMMLTVRLIPLQWRALQEALEARAARGASWSMTALGVPVIVRSIRRARALDEALRARGVGDR